MMVLLQLLTTCIPLSTLLTKIFIPSNLKLSKLCCHSISIEFFATSLTTELRLRNVYSSQYIIDVYKTEMSGHLIL